VPTERFRLLVGHAPCCIHEIDLDGKLTAMNPAGLVMMGASDEDAIRGLPYLDVVSDADRPRVKNLLKLALLGGAAHFEFSSAGDEPRDFSSNFIPVHDSDGAFRGLMGVSQDVTDQRRAERALRSLNDSLEAQVEARTAALQRANQRLTVQNQELGEFGRAISHDLRSPLTSILGVASLLEDLSPRPEQAAKLALIVESAAHMAGMIDELLELAKVGDLVEVETDGADLEQVLGEVCASLAHEIETTSAKVTHAPLPHVDASPIEQHRLLQNLVGNALKFRGDRPPEVHVSAERVEFGWAVSVRDNGLGFPEEEREAIFHVFHRSPEVLDRPGSGVGLSICKKLVEARGGTLDASSVRGEGSTFTYTVPVTPPAP